MEINSKEYLIYKSIDFVNRYQALSQSFQFDEEMEYSNDRVLCIIEKLGYKARYIKKNDFFKIENKVDGFKFYLHICLKYSNVELMLGATDLSKDEFITGDVFVALFEDIKYAEGVSIERNILDPKFRTYSDLEEILKESLSIYEDFKKSFLLHITS